MRWHRHNSLKIKGIGLASSVGMLFCEFIFDGPFWSFLVRSKWSLNIDNMLQTCFQAAGVNILESKKKKVHVFYSTVLDCSHYIHTNHFVS